MIVAKSDKFNATFQETANLDNIAAMANSTAHLTEDADDITYMAIAYSSYIMKNIAAMEQISEDVSVFSFHHLSMLLFRKYIHRNDIRYVSLCQHISPLRQRNREARLTAL